MSHDVMVGTVGEVPPAMSVSWAPPVGPGDSGYLVFFSEFDPDEIDEQPLIPVCLHCLLEDDDGQLGRGLDLAREHGQVDWDWDDGVWFVPDDAMGAVGDS